MIRSLLNLPAWTGWTTTFPPPHKPAVPQHSIHCRSREGWKRPFSKCKPLGAPKDCPRVYRKPTHTDRYIPFTPSPKDNYWATACMTEPSRSAPTQPGSLRLGTWRKVFKLIAFWLTLACLPAPAPPPAPNEESSKTFCTPYICGLSEKLKKVCNAIGFITAFQPVMTLYTYTADPHESEDTRIHQT